MIILFFLQRAVRWVSGASGGRAPEETKHVASSGDWRLAHGILWRNHQGTRYPALRLLSPGGAKCLCDTAGKVRYSIYLHSFGVNKFFKLNSEKLVANLMNLLLDLETFSDFKKKKGSLMQITFWTDASDCLLLETALKLTSHRLVMLREQVCSSA